jgi:hypothetical protein
MSLHVTVWKSVLAKNKVPLVEKVLKSTILGSERTASLTRMNANVSHQVGPLDKLLWTVWTFVSWPIVNQKMFIITILTLQQKIIYNNSQNLNTGQVLSKKRVLGLQNRFMQDSESVHPGLQQYYLNLSPNKNSGVHWLIICFMQILL